MTTGDGTHTEHEDFGWTIDVGDHPQRADSPEYTRSRALMVKLVQTTQPWVFGDKPYQDHHGGGIWVLDEQGWMLLLSPFGIEWSAQFCADPAKVDTARTYANRLLAKFPSTVAGYEALGYHDAAGLLATQITDADQIEAWTDGIFNASVPLPVSLHTGTLTVHAAGLPHVAGYHHYPKPIIDILLFKHDDFELFVPDEHGTTIAVTPMGRRGSGSVRVAWQPDSAPRGHPGGAAILPPESSAEQHAFARQTNSL